jgi:hypothetical protein
VFIIVIPEQCKKKFLSNSNFTEKIRNKCHSNSFQGCPLSCPCCYCFLPFTLHESGSWTGNCYLHTKQRKHNVKMSSMIVHSHWDMSCLYFFITVYYKCTVNSYITTQILLQTNRKWLLYTYLPVNYTFFYFKLMTLPIKTIRVWCYCHFQQFFHYIVAVSFIGWGNWSTRRKPLICRKSLTKFIRKCCIEYTSPEWDSDSQC